MSCNILPVLEFVVTDKWKKCADSIRKLTVPCKWGELNLHKSGTGKEWEILPEFCWQSH